MSKILQRKSLEEERDELRTHKFRIRQETKTLLLYSVEDISVPDMRKRLGEFKKIYDECSNSDNLCSPIIDPMIRNGRGHVHSAVKIFFELSNRFDPDDRTGCRKRMQPSYEEFLA